MMKIEWPNAERYSLEIICLFAKLITHKFQKSAYNENNILSLSYWIFKRFYKIWVVET